MDVTGSEWNYKSMSYIPSKQIASQEASTEDELTSNRVNVFAPSQKEPFYINADKVRVYEVISNLLSNAIKFTSRKAGRRSITIKTEKKDSQANVSIKDTGPGIHPEIMPKLFSKFVTNSPGGTGIGLFISKRGSWWKDMG